MTTAKAWDEMTIPTPYDWIFEEANKYSVGMLQRFDGQRAAYREGYQKRAEEDDARYAKLVEACKIALDYFVEYDLQNKVINEALTDLEAK